MKKYTFKLNEDNWYEEVYGPDGEWITTLTEPEDRWCYRDVGPLIEELNRLYKENRKFRAIIKRKKLDNLL